MALRAFLVTRSQVAVPNFASWGCASLSLVYRSTLSKQFEMGFDLGLEPRELALGRLARREGADLDP